MPPEAAIHRRALVIQLARLGDLVQSLPAIQALQQCRPERPVDLLCSAPLAPLFEGSRTVERLIPWDGAQWRTWAGNWPDHPTATLRAMETYLSTLGVTAYDRLYNLNQHPRAMLLTHLFSRRRVDREDDRHLGPESPWAQYLRQVATERGANRVHLADAWCGLCGVRPRGLAPCLNARPVELSKDLSAIGERPGRWVALVTGAGDQARCLPAGVWASWIREFLTQIDDGQVVLIGSGHEREAGQAILEAIPALLQGRVWDTTGRTTLPQLMTLLGRCSWTVGADTGPLHLATAVGSRVLGFYFARARVHETGPYGEGHWAYQHYTQAPPDGWPIQESIGLIGDGARHTAPGWTLWRSHLDRWGVLFDDGSASQAMDLCRAAVWHACSPTLTESVAA